jgi:AcrR family transcriptional regulator
MQASSQAWPESLYEQLPARGRRNVLDHDAVASNQRSRLIGAMIEEVAEHGYADATLARLVALAGVSKRTFHEQFGTKQDYFLATFDAIVGNAMKRIGMAYRSEGDWQAKLCAAFAAYAAEVVDEPKAARLVLVEAFGAGPAAVARMQRSRLIFEQMVSASLTEASDGVTPPPLIAKGIVCGIERITRRRLLAGDVAELPALANELLAWTLAYRSPAAAALGAASSADRHAHVPCCPRPAVENDWARILYSAAEIAAANGYLRLTPGQIVCESGVTEARFDELFESTEQCFLDALDRLGLEVLVCAARAFQSGEQGLAGIHRAIAALMRHIATDPVLVQVAFVEIFALGPAGISRRELLLDQFTDYLMQILPKSRAPSRLEADASVGAVWGIIHHYVTRGAADLLPGLAGHVTYIALAPVVGGEIAVEVVLAGEAV